MNFTLFSLFNKITDFTIILDSNIQLLLVLTASLLSPSRTLILILQLVENQILFPVYIIPFKNLIIYLPQSRTDSFSHSILINILRIFAKNNYFSQF